MILVDDFYYFEDQDPNWILGLKKEIWEDQEYTRYGLDIKEGDIVLDCGANVGIFSKFALDKGAQHVYSFECDPSVFELLKLNLQDHSNVSLIKGYISDRFEFEHFNLQTILSMFNLDTIDFAKIDIEFWEYPLLLNMPIDTLIKVKQYVIEVHDIYNNGYQILQILEKLSQNGYSINFEHIHKNTNLGMIYAKKNL